MVNTRTDYDHIENVVVHEWTHYEYGVQPATIPGTPTFIRASSSSIAASPVPPGITIHHHHHRCHDKKKQERCWSLRHERKHEVGLDQLLHRLVFCILCFALTAWGLYLLTLSTPPTWGPIIVFSTIGIGYLLGMLSVIWDCNNSTVYSVSHTKQELEISWEPWPLFGAKKVSTKGVKDVVCKKTVGIDAEGKPSVSVHICFRYEEDNAVKVVPIRKGQDLQTMVFVAQQLEAAVLSEDGRRQNDTETVDTERTVPYAEEDEDGSLATGCPSIEMGVAT